MTGDPMPLVSVVVPNYNHARFLRQRIDSILTQTCQDFELILLDDCSTDDSREVLSSYASNPRTRLEFDETNSGSPFKQWNKGVRLARGKYVWIAESDDYADARLLERLVPALETDREVVFAYCRSRRIREDDRLEGFADYYLDDWNGELWKADFCTSGSELCRNFFCGTNVVPNASAVVFRKDVYQRVGGPDESLRLCGDWKLWVAMALGNKVVYVAEPLNYFRYHPKSVRRQTRNLALDVAEYLAVSRWVLGQVPVSGETRRRVLKTNACLWVAGMLSPFVARETKREIMEAVRAIDPRPMQTALRVLPGWFWRTSVEMLANDVYYPLLNVSYRARHASGLTREGLGRLRARIAGSVAGRIGKRRRG